MLKETRTTWTIKRLAKEVKKGNVKFDNAVQRSLVWTKDQKSLLIDSVLEGYPVPPMYADKDTDTGKLDMLDGKQRSNTLIEFINDEFSLTKIVNEIDCEEEGEKVDIVGLKFSELPEEFRDRICDYTIEIKVFDNLLDEERNELFRRINNGKPLSSIELTRVKARSLPIIQEIANHDIFTHALTAKAFSKYTHEDIVIKAYAELFTENPSFETKVVRPLMEEVEITEEQKNQLIASFDKLLGAYTELKSREITDKEESKKRDRVCKRMLTRTHLLSLMPLAIDDNITTTDLAEFCYKFFYSSKTTINEVYNANASRGTGKAESVQNRLREIKKSYNEFVSRREYTPKTTENTTLDNTEVDEETLRNCVNDIMSISNDTMSISA